MKQFALACIVFFVCLAVNAYAEEPEVYFGGGIASPSILSTTSQGFPFKSSSLSPTTGNTFSLLVGTNLNKRLGIEIGMARLGTYSVKDNASQPLGTYNVSATTLALKFGGNNYSSNSLTIFGKAGFAQVKTNYTPQPNWVLNGFPTQSTVGFTAGIGSHYFFQNGIGLRLALDVIKYKDAEFENLIENVALLLVYRL